MKIDLESAVAGFNDCVDNFNSSIKYGGTERPKAFAAMAQAFATVILAAKTGGQ